MYRVLGFEKVDYVSKKGNRVVGHKLYLGYTAEKITGIGVLDCYISDNNDYVPQLDDVVELYYNRFGQVSKIAIVE